MGLWKAISNRVRSQKNQLAKDLANPVEDGKLAIEDSKKQITDYQSKVAKLVAETKRLERTKAEKESEVKKYQNIAQKAAEAGNENDARTALEMKEKSTNELTTIKSELKSNNTLVTRLRGDLTKARARVSDAQSNITRLEARMEGAKIRTELAKASSEFGDGSSLSSLDDLQKAVEEKESLAEAHEDMAEQENEGEALEDKYSKGESKVDDELSKLMASSKK